MNNLNIGVLGSAFNMPTLGHADVVRQALEHFDQVWLVPSFSHAFGKKMMDYHFRVRLTDAFAEDLKNIFGKERVVSMPIEAMLASLKTPVYTYDVLEYLETINENYLLGQAKFSVIIGPDNLENWSKFYNHQEIDNRWGKFVACSDVDIRSTLVRNALMNKEDVSNYLTPTVLDIMNENIAELEKLMIL